MVQAALAGYGIAVAVAGAAGRVEKWWEPKWRSTMWAFIVLRTTATIAAAAAVTAAALNNASTVAALAAGTVAWLLAQGYVLLLVATRR